MLDGVIVNPTSEPPDRAFAGEVVKGYVYGFAAPQFQEIGWNEDAPPPASSNGRKYRSLNGLWLFFLALHLRNTTPFFLMIQAFFAGASSEKSKKIVQSLDVGAFVATAQGNPTLPWQKGRRETVEADDSQGSGETAS